MTTIRSLFAIIGISGIATVSGVGHGSKARISLTKGTVIPATLAGDISSDRSKPGDRFTATVRSNYLGLPEGTRATGIVRSVRVKTKDKPGTLSISFTRLLLPGGKAYPIDGSPVGLDDKSVSRIKGGRIVAKPGVKNQRLTYIGYGAGAGFVIGLLSGSNRVAEKTVIGGALGYLAGALTKGSRHNTNNVLLRSGTELGIKIEKPVTVRF